MAAITPIYDYDFTILHNVVTEASWRQLLFWLGPPGLVVAALALLTLDEPRAPGSAPSGDPFASSKFINPATRAMSRSRGDRFVEKGAEARAKSGVGGVGGAPVAAVAPAAAAALPASSVAALVSSPSSSPSSVADPSSKPSVWESVKALCGSRAFQAITAAAAINDVGSWSLVAFQATFYQRVYELGPETYAPALAVILPIGGILGGVGGGLLADGEFFFFLSFEEVDGGTKIQQDEEKKNFSHSLFVSASPAQKKKKASPAPEGATSSPAAPPSSPPPSSPSTSSPRTTARRSPPCSWASASPRCGAPRRRSWSGTCRRRTWARRGRRCTCACGTSSAGWGLWVRFFLVLFFFFLKIEFFFFFISLSLSPSPLSLLPTNTQL